MVVNALVGLLTVILANPGQAILLYSPQAIAILGVFGLLAPGSSPAVVRSWRFGHRRSGRPPRT